MKGRRLEATLWLLALTLVCWSAFRGSRLRPAAQATAVTLPGAAAIPAAFPLERLFVAATTAAETDPFRLERHPSAVPYKPGFEGAPPPPPPPRPPRPNLALSGTIGGPPWAALIEGMPGREGSILVRQGDLLGDFRIALVTRDSVIVEGADTTWNLKLKRVWK